MLQHELVGTSFIPAKSQALPGLAATRRHRETQNAITSPHYRLVPRPQGSWRKTTGSEPSSQGCGWRHGVRRMSEIE